MRFIVGIGKHGALQAANLERILAERFTADEFEVVEVGGHESTIDAQARAVRHARHLFQINSGRASIFVGISYGKDLKGRPSVFAAACNAEGEACQVLWWDLSGQPSIPALRRQIDATVFEGLAMWLSFLRPPQVAEPAGYEWSPPRLLPGPRT